MKIEFLEPAELEFAEAVAYYNHEQVGLSERFRQEIQQSLLRIANYPKSYHQISARTRRCIVAKFPYGIIYQYRVSLRQQSVKEKVAAPKLQQHHIRQPEKTMYADNSKATSSADCERHQTSFVASAPDTRTH